MFVNSNSLPHKILLHGHQFAVRFFLNLQIARQSVDRFRKESSQNETDFLDGALDSLLNVNTSAISPVKNAAFPDCQASIGEFANSLGFFVELRIVRCFQSCRLRHHFIGYLIADLLLH